MEYKTKYIQGQIYIKEFAQDENLRESQNATKAIKMLYNDFNVFLGFYFLGGKISTILSN